MDQEHTMVGIHRSRAAGRVLRTGLGIAFLAMAVDGGSGMLRSGHWLLGLIVGLASAAAGFGASYLLPDVLGPRSSGELRRRPGPR